MSLRINQNVLSIQTYGSLAQTSGRMAKSIEKLSSGLRINRAADDAAGLAISEKMRRQIRGLNRATLNAQDGISMIQTAEGALSESHSILQRMRELAIQSSNDTLTSSDRMEIQKEVNQLREDLNRISRNTEFNTKKLLDGSQTALISTSSSFTRGVVTGGAEGSNGDFNVSISLMSAGISQMQRTQIYTRTDGELAQGTTQLQSVAQFYDANGVFVLDSPLSLNINGSSKTTSIELDAQMTLDNLAADLQNALVSNSGLDIDNSRVAVVNTTQTKVAGLGGYIEVISGSVGENGDVSFAGDQKLIDALGLTTIRESVNNRVELTMKDSFGNLRQVKTETDRAVGLLNGIDVEFKSQAAQIAGVSGLESGMFFSGQETFWANIGSHSVQLTVDAGYWTMEGIARNFNHQIATAIDGAAQNNLLGLNAAVVEGEIRLSYNKPATAAASIGTSINITSAAGSILGFLDGSYSGFTDGKKDQTKIEWGFTTYRKDVASGDRTYLDVGDGVFTVTLEIISSTTTSNAGSVTLADMVSFINFQATINDQLEAGSVAARVDQVGGTMAFTSLRVGNENRDNLAAYTSLLSVQINTAAAGATLTAGESLLINLGMNEGTVKGVGDKNFRMHVVDNTPQFQIGADQGQTMGVSMSDMSAEALDVDSLDMTSVAGAQDAIGKINIAIDRVSAERSKLGAFQNRLEYAINNLRSTHSNLTAAESRIRDADIANEMIEFTRNQIVSQSGTAMLAQANLIPQGVLQLLQ